MRVDLIELLRCPANHELAPLITVADRRDGEHLLDASLGCVVCGASYPLRDGVLQLSGNDTGTSAESTGETTPFDLTEAATRIAALLGLADASSRAMLCGRALGLAQAVESMTGAQIVHLNPSDDALNEVMAVALTDVMMLSPATRIPMADRSLSGLAVDWRHLPLLDDATRVVRVGGRILAPVHAPLPHGCRELARDEREWVAEVESATSAPIGLTRSR